MWDCETVWGLLKEHQGELFYTVKGLPFRYRVRGGELFVDRRAKSITISTVSAALKNIDARLQANDAVTGPKKIGVYGASYLYPVFCRLGVIPAASQKEAGPQEQAAAVSEEGFSSNG